MRTEGRTHLDVPTHQLKLGRSKSLNTPRTAASIVAMNVRPKRTHSLPNRERSSLPIVQINSSDNDRFEEDYYSDEKEGERTGYGTSTANYTSGGGRKFKSKIIYRQTYSDEKKHGIFSQCSLSFNTFSAIVRY